MKQIGRIIYIDGFGNFIGTERDRLYIKTKDSPSKFTFHFFDLDALVVTSNCSFSSQAIIELNNHGVEVIFSDWTGRFHGRFEGPKNKNIFIRRAQIFASNSREKTMLLAKEIVSSKIEAMNSCFEFGDVQIALLKIAECRDYEELLGIEGYYSKKYFEFLGFEFEKLKFAFNGRKFHPAPDPVNALLSLSYHLLFTEVGIIARIFAFDPSFGFLHRDYYGRESLICDLMEPFRSTVADKFVIKAIKEIDIRKGDFEVFEGECTFSDKDKRSSFFKLFRSSFLTETHRMEMLEFARSIYNKIIDLPEDESLLITDKGIA